MDFDAFINRANWVWAKTYAEKAPHWYCVRKEFGDDPTFDEAVRYIRENSIEAYFWGKKFRYCFHNGYKYWTMGNPVSETTIINRTKI